MKAASRRTIKKLDMNLLEGYERHMPNKDNPNEDSAWGRRLPVDTFFNRHKIKEDNFHDELIDFSVKIDD